MFLGHNGEGTSPSYSVHGRRQTKPPKKQNKNNNNKTSWDGTISLHEEAQRLGPKCMQTCVNTAGFAFVFAFAYRWECMYMLVFSCVSGEEP